MNLIGLLVALLIFCVVLWAVRALLAAFSIGDPIATVVYVLLVLIFVVYLAGLFGVGPGLRLT
jgi:hypothetical protein